MKRIDFYHLVQPLTEKLFTFAYTLLPDDLQAEQLVIDGVNAFLLKEKKNLLNKEVDQSNKKDVQLYKRYLLKGILRYMSTIGVRRANQLSEQMRLSRPEEFAPYYSLDPKVRLILKLRYEAQFSVEEIGEIVQIPRFEVIEKIHNGRFLLLNDVKQGIIRD